MLTSTSTVRADSIGARHAGVILVRTIESVAGERGAVIVGSTDVFSGTTAGGSGGVIVSNIASGDAGVGTANTDTGDSRYGDASTAIGIGTPRAARMVAGVFLAREGDTSTGTVPWRVATMAGAGARRSTAVSAALSIGRIRDGAWDPTAMPLTVEAATVRHHPAGAFSHADLHQYLGTEDTMATWEAMNTHRRITVVGSAVGRGRPVRSRPWSQPRARRP